MGVPQTQACAGTRSDCRRTAADESGFNYGVNAHFTSGNGSFGGLSGIRWDEEQNDISIDLSFPPRNCLSYIPFG
jgi:hypothetical protein